MLFFYTRYEYVLGNKVVSATLKNQAHSETYDLEIITPAIKFFWFLPMGGGLVKISRLYNAQGELLHAKNYSSELKNEIKQFKKTLKVPYLKLWSGYLILLSIALIGSVIYGMKMKKDATKFNEQTERLTQSLQNLQKGQCYAASFFTDENGNQINGLPAGWIRIERIDGDTIFVKRSLEVAYDKALFKMEDLTPIKPTTDAEWNPKTEKLNYSLLKNDLTEEDKKQFNLMYIGSDHEKYQGVIMTLKGVE